MTDLPALRCGWAVFPPLDQGDIHHGNCKKGRTGQESRRSGKESRRSGKESRCSGQESRCSGQEGRCSGQEGRCSGEEGCCSGEEGCCSGEEGRCSGQEGCCSGQEGCCCQAGRQGPCQEGCGREEGACQACPCEVGRQGVRQQGSTGEDCADGKDHAEPSSGMAFPDGQQALSKTLGLTASALKRPPSAGVSHGVCPHQQAPSWA